MLLGYSLDYQRVSEVQSVIDCTRTESTSHILMLISSDAEAKNTPSGDHAISEFPAPGAERVELERESAPKSMMDTT